MGRTTLNKSIISYKMRLFRSAQGIGQRELASYLGCSVEQICRWERSRHMPRPVWIAVMKDKGVI